MAVSDTTDEPQVNLTHRLVGAAVLIAVAVVILPMLLAGENDEQSSVTALQTTVKEVDEEFVSKIKPRDSESSLDDSAQSSQQPQQNLQDLLDRSAGDEQSSAAGTGGQNTGAQTTAAMAPDPAPTDDSDNSGSQTDTSRVDAANADSAGAGRGWIVRLGTYKQAPNADQIMLTLREKGFEPQSAEVDTGVGRATRVWVGPYSKRVTASRILNRVEGEIGVKGFISAYP